MLCGSSDGSGQEDGGENRGIEFYYDDGAGSGLRPLPSCMSDFVDGSTELQAKKQQEKDENGEELPSDTSSKEGRQSIMVL